MENVTINVDDKNYVVVQSSWLNRNVSFSQQTRRGLLLDMLKSATTKQIPIEYWEHYRKTILGLGHDHAATVFHVELVTILKNLVTVMVAPVTIALDLVDILNEISLLPTVEQVKQNDLKGDA